MTNSAHYAEALPPYSKSDPLCQSWAEASQTMFKLVLDDAMQMMRDVRSLCPLPLLPDFQIDPILFEQPSNNMGGLRLLCPDKHHSGLGRPTVANMTASGVLNGCYGIEIGFELVRRSETELKPPSDKWPSFMEVTLMINDDPELNAFREVYRDWRGIVKKMMEGTLIDVNACCNVFPELESVRSKHPIPRLDAIFSIPSPKDYMFQLQFKWRPDTDWEIGLRSFLVQTILFTCIQKATAAPRSRRDHLLGYWLAVEKAWKKLG